MRSEARPHWLWLTIWSLIGPRWQRQQAKIRRRQVNFLRLGEFLPPWQIFTDLVNFRRPGEFLPTWWIFAVSVNFQQWVADFRHCWRISVTMYVISFTYVGLKTVAHLLNLCKNLLILSHLISSFCFHLIMTLVWISFSKKCPWSWNRSLTLWSFKSLVHSM